MYIGPILYTWDATELRPYFLAPAPAPGDSETDFPEFLSNNLNIKFGRFKPFSSELQIRV